MFIKFRYVLITMPEAGDKISTTRSLPSHFLTILLGTTDYKKVDE